MHALCIFVARGYVAPIWGSVKWAPRKANHDESINVSSLFSIVIFPREALEGRVQYTKKKEVMETSK